MMTTTFLFLMVICLVFELETLHWPVKKMGPMYFLNGIGMDKYLTINLKKTDSQKINIFCLTCSEETFKTLYM